MAEKKTFHGSCQCGHVRYTVAIAIPSDGPVKAYRCNCTFCQKSGFTSFQLPSGDDFKLLSPASWDECSDHRRQRGNSDVHKYFCGTCGAQIVNAGHYEHDGKVHNIFSLNFATIDQPQEGLDFSEVQMQYCDGLHDNWGAGMKDKPWSGGLV
jgi:hypothetical protein